MRRVNAVADGEAHIADMIEHEVIEIGGTVARCSGPAEARHREIEILVGAGKVSTCPLCGRRFRRDGRPSVGLAAWPKEE